MKQVMFLCFWLVLGASSVSNATSCLPKSNRIIAECKNAVCNEIFYVKEVRANTYCSRRPTIENVPDWGKEVLEYELVSGDLANKSGVFELVLSGNTGNLFSNAKGYIDLAEAVGNKRYDFSTLILLSASSIIEVRSEWNAKVLDEYQKMIFSKAIAWGGLLIGLAFLVFSISWFSKWIAGGSSFRWLIMSLAVQVFLLTLSFLNVISMNVTSFSLFVILVPGVLFYELVYSAIVYKAYLGRSKAYKESL